MGITGKITPKTANTVIKRRFILSCSNLDVIDLLSLLEVKGFLVNHKPTASKNFEFEFYKPKIAEQENYVTLIKKLNELKDRNEQIITNQIEFLEELYIINLDLPLTNQLESLDQNLSILENSQECQHKYHSP